jgi:hypothetical protein
MYNKNYLLINFLFIKSLYYYKKKYILIYYKIKKGIVIDIL